MQLIRLFFGLVMFYTCATHAQEKSNNDFIAPIATDRPDQTETPDIVPAGMFQMETGFSFEKTNKYAQNTTAPTVLMKYGLNENFELRVITDVVFDKWSDQNTSGLKPILVGFKAVLSKEDGLLPQTSFIAHLAMPNLASTPYKLPYFAPEFRFSMQHTVSKKIRVGYNLGAEWDGTTPEPTFIYTLTAGFELSQKVGYYIEVFGFAPQRSSANHSLDTGFTYLLSNNFMVDVSGGFGLTQNAPDYYTALGFSWRI